MVRIASRSQERHGQQGRRRQGAREEHRSARARAERTLIQTIRQIPAYLKLLAGLLRDPRVSRLDKLLVAGAIAYIISPIDLIPDFIPFLGQVDDIYLLVLSLQRLISNAGMVVIEDHWAGDPADLSARGLRNTLLAASLFLPRRLRRRIRRGI
jgi:uncharacterized membrane protein YkvA (DUF1232 family)